MALSYQAIIWTLLEPWYWMLYTFRFIPAAIRNILHQQEYSTFASPSRLQDAWFASTWSVLGPRFAQGSEERVTGLLSRARGVVLDIGPGAGYWVHIYANPTVKQGITHIYGIEPNLSSHAALRRRVEDAGLSDIYTIIGAGIEDLPKLDVGIGTDTVDTIVTKQVLCSVPNPAVLIKDLYNYLKPGGIWLMYEHVKTHETDWVATWQQFCNLGWPVCYGGCNLTRPTDLMIQKVGRWEEVNVAPVEGQQDNRFIVLPGVAGYFVKASE